VERVLDVARCDAAGRRGREAKLAAADRGHRVVAEPSCAHARMVAPFGG
jgi:hypothetical protein